jgi:hypothetical protein
VTAVSAKVGGPRVIRTDRRPTKQHYVPKKSLQMLYPSFVFGQEGMELQAGLLRPLDWPVRHVRRKRPERLDQVLDRIRF